MTLVIDTSAAIAVLRSEPGAEKIAYRLKGAAISAVNFAELMTYGVRGGADVEEFRTDIEGLEMNVHAFDGRAAVITGSLAATTRRFGLSLGDRACLALAKMLDGQVVTADRVWAKLDLGIPIEVIR
jgi:PIN domain nuclease of toxin-antitoxin system